MISSAGYYDTVDDYQKHYLYLSRYHGYMFSYGQALSKNGEYEKSTKVLTLGTKVGSDPMFYNIIANNYYMLGDTSSAEQYYLRAYHTLPNRLYPLYLLTKMYHESNMDYKARELANELLQKLPKVPSTAVKEMKDYAKNVLEQSPR